MKTIPSLPFEVVSNFNMVRNGKRVAVFARPNPKSTVTHTEICVITCSPYDTFSKKRAKEIYYNFIAGYGAQYDETIVSGNPHIKQIYKIIHHKSTPDFYVVPFVCRRDRVNTYLKILGMKPYYPFSDVKENIKDFIATIKKTGDYVDNIDIVLARPKPLYVAISRTGVTLNSETSIGVFTSKRSAYRQKDCIIYKVLPNELKSLDELQIHPSRYAEGVGQ